MDFFEIILQQKLAKGSGGSSSDYTTAEVTVIKDRADLIYIPYLYEEGGESAILSIGIAESGTYNVPIYKGTLVGTVAGGMDIIVQVSGNAEWIEEGQMVIITGDCTITTS